MTPAPGDPTVSVVIANHDGAAFLAQAVRSALAQTLRAIEVIIADDGSSDASPAIAAALAGADPRVTVIASATSTGPGGARNRAIDAARGAWIAVLDHDDLMHPDRLRRLIDHAEATGADIVADDLLLFDEDDAAAPRRFLNAPETLGPFPVTLGRYVEATRMYGRKPNLGFLKPIVRRSALGAMRYDERLRIGEDDDLILRLLAAGLSYRVLPSLGYHYRKHGRSISHRLSVADLTAMIAAGARARRAWPALDPPTDAALRAREASLVAALAFQHFVEAMKARRPLRAMTALARRPGAVPLLRLPVRDRLARAVGRRPDERIRAPGERHILFVSRQRLRGRDNGSSAYLLDLAAAARAAGMTPHLLQPSPTMMGRRPWLRLDPDLAVFATHRVRGVVQVGRWLVSRDPAVWRAALAGMAARLFARIGLRSFRDVPFPHSIAIPWTDDDRLYVARHGRRHADAIVADYVFQAEAIASVLRPDAPSAIVMHDLYSARAGSFGALADRDPVAGLSAEAECAMLARADAVIAIQPDEAAFVAREVPGVRVILAPIAARPVAAAQPGAIPDTLLFVASNTAPNVIALEWFFADIWPSVRARRPGARLTVAGTVADAFARAPAGVRFLGRVADLSGLYRDAALVVSPLRTGSGLKVKLVDALAQGKAIVATGVTLQGVEDWVGGAVARADDAAAFAAAIEALLADGAARAALAEAALAVAHRRFTPETCYAQFVRWAGRGDR